MLGNRTHYKEIRDHIADWYGIGLPIKDIETAMEVLEKDDPEYWQEEYDCKSYTDTLPREQIAWAIATTFIGQDWPRLGDSKEAKKDFSEKLNKVIKERNWKTDGELTME